jgi:hypothetical protein
LVGIAGRFDCGANDFYISFEARGELAADGFEVNYFCDVAGCFKEIDYLGIARSCGQAPGTNTIVGLTCDILWIEI